MPVQKAKLRLQEGACQPPLALAAIYGIHGNLAAPIRPIDFCPSGPDSGVANDAPVAQLDRAAAFEAAGREFESLRARHISQQLSNLAHIVSSGHHAWVFGLRETMPTGSQVLAWETWIQRDGGQLRNARDRTQVHFIMR
jgi:hypothetical protein